MSYQGLGAGRVEHRRPHGQLSAEKEASVWFAWRSCHRSRSRRFWVAWCPLGWASSCSVCLHPSSGRLNARTAEGKCRWEPCCKAGGCGGMESRLDKICGYGLNGCTNGPLSRDRLPTNGSGFKSHWVMFVGIRLMLKSNVCGLLQMAKASQHAVGKARCGALVELTFSCHVYLVRDVEVVASLFLRTVLAHSQGILSKNPI